MAVSNEKEQSTQEDMFYKEDEDSQIWWLETENIGEWWFSFDKNRLYNMFRDFPFAMSKGEVEIFCKENPYWANFFKDRLEEYYNS